MVRDCAASSGTGRLAGVSSASSIARSVTARRMAATSAGAAKRRTPTEMRSSRPFGSDQLTSEPLVASRRARSTMLRAMMGGLAVYSDGRIFALVAGGERIWLKAAGGFAARLAEEGGERFTYARRDGVTARMGYWSLPDAALDDPEAACGWARAALRAQEAAAPAG